MPLVPPQDLAKLQTRPERMRNICVVAHVDHGKTTLSDCLISSNGIISSKVAGKIRYLDSLDDEQERGITMKSSSISLLFQQRNAADANVIDNYLVNLIDSPGHVDFSGEVSTAVRVSDGALVVVDVVEGVCIQTDTVLRAVYADGARPVLVLNKIDRLVSEMQLTPMEAYEHLMRIIEQVNAITATHFRGEQLEIADQERQRRKAEPQDAADADEWTLDDLDDEGLYFSPAAGNVVFACAYEGWAFGVSQFADLYARKLGVRREVLLQTLWGEFYFHPKSKKIFKTSQNGRLRPMFVQFVLEPIWQVHDAVVQHDTEKRDKIIASLGLTIPPRELKLKDPRAVLQGIMGRWLPLSRAVLDMVVAHVPDPRRAQAERIPKIWPSLADAPAEISRAVLDCDNSPSAPTVVFVSKVFAVDRDQLPSSKASLARQARLQAHAASADTGTEGAARESDEGEEREREEEEEEDNDDGAGQAFVAFGRVLSGRLKRGQAMHVLGPKYTPTEPDKHRVEAPVRHLYMMMGRELEELDEVPAGSVLGMGGLGAHVLKTATLASAPACPSFPANRGHGDPIVRVAVETKKLSDMPALIEGLRLLNQADSAVEVRLQDSGEHVVIASGELHLERCLNDLRERFAKVRIQVSKPIVPFRETVAEPDPAAPRPAESETVIETHTAGKTVSLRFRALPLPAKLTALLERSTSQLRGALDAMRAGGRGEELRELFGEIETHLGKMGMSLQDNFLAFGPRHTGANLFLSRVPGLARNSVWRAVSGGDGGSECSERLAELYGSLVSGFQLATHAGPLCNEPMMGVGFVIEAMDVGTAADGAGGAADDDAAGEGDGDHGPLTGQVLAATKAGLRQAFQAQPQRLMEPMFLCDIMAKDEVLGAVYAVLGKRRAKIIQEDMKEGTALFTIQARLPVAESFGFSAQLRSQTSGAANPQLIFDGFSILDQDPFHKAVTEEELEEWGEQGSITSNIARKYVDDVRRRKGLHVEEKLVEAAEKQRTLGKNK